MALRPPPVSATRAAPLEFLYYPTGGGGSAHPRSMNAIDRIYPEHPIYGVRDLRRERDHVLIDP